MTHSPRVTLGVATYSRDTYLAEAVASCLAQDYQDLEVVVVVDGSVNPRIDEVLATFADPRLRVVRHPTNLGISEAYNTIIREGRGELIAMLGDDDVCLPDRISRSVAIFDEHPDTGVVHGDAYIIDADGVEHGVQSVGNFKTGALLECLWRIHNVIIDPTRLVHRRVYEAVGGYHPGYTLAQDFHFWLRAAPRFPFRHVEGEPLIRLRRHGDNFSDESMRPLEIEQVERALSESLEREPLELLVPEVDWPLLDPLDAEREALRRLACHLSQRALPLPRLARRVLERAQALPASPPPARSKGKLLMTAFGWDDAGGGTMLPRFAARELVRRGWDVTVFHAAVAPDPSGVPYALREWEDCGVRLVGVHNRPHGLLDQGRPDRELDDAPITTAFEDVMDRFQPDVVHFHNLHNLGAALLDVAHARGVPSYFTTHNYWLVCPRAYLLRGDNSLCGGPGDAGGDCATCIGADAAQPDAYRHRLATIRDAFSRAITTCLTVSHGVRRTLIDQGYPADALDVVRQSVPAEEVAWERVGRDRAPGRVDERALTVGFFGSVYAHKGAQLLVQAAQLTDAPLRVRIHGEISGAMERQLRAIDRRGVLEVAGKFAATVLPDHLARVDVAALPSLWWDCAPLVAGECLAARVPVLAPRMGGLAEAIRDEVDGLAFDGGDAAGLAAQLQRLATEPGLLERLQSNIEAPRGFGAYVDELEQYYAGRRPSRVVEEPETVVAWAGEHDAPTSLARINRSVTAALQDDPSLIVRAAATDRASAPAPLPHAADVEVRHQWPPDFRPPASGHLALIQPWEFGSIPTAWVEPLQTMVDELWVPSEHVRRMYLDAGLEPDRVAVVPNGVDLSHYSPEGPKLDLDGAGGGGVRFLFVGGAIARKGIDVLLSAFGEAFAGRDDVSLIVKDFGADGVYRGGDRAELLRMVAEGGRGGVPRVVHLTQTLADDEVAALYRACDVLVHPYRGEGFAMPVLEAMACGLPSIVTAGGPTDEFCPAGAGWRIPSAKALLPGRRIGDLPLAGEAWMLEPDRDALVELLRESAEVGEAERARRGAAARVAAAGYGWDAVAARYAERIRGLSARPPRIARLPAVDLELAAAARPRLLAVPAYRGHDELAALLGAWAAAAPAGTPGTLILVADPARDGTPEQVEGHIVAAATAAGVELDGCADIEVRFLHATPGRDAALHAATDGFVALHGASAGHARHARAAGNALVTPDAEALRAFLDAPAATPDLGSAVLTTA
jgi:glycosyltransferase involved in cell wall biosynthesis